MMVKMMGMDDKVYWTVTYFWNLMIYCVFVLVLWVGGNLIGLSFFTLNSTSIQFLFYFIYGNLQIAWTILVSTVFSKSKTATVASYLYVFLSGLVANVLLTFFVQSTVVPEAIVTILQLIPAFSLYRGLYEFAQYAFEGAYRGEDGMMWTNLGDEENGLLGAMVIMLVEWVLFLLVAMYLDQVLDAGTGVRRAWNYCLQKPRKATDQQLMADGGSPEAGDSSKGGAALDQAASPAAVVIEAAGLRKVWPALGGMWIRNLSWDILSCVYPLKMSHFASWTGQGIRRRWRWMGSTCG